MLHAKEVIYYTLCRFDYTVIEQLTENQMKIILALFGTLFAFSENRALCPASLLTPNAGALWSPKKAIKSSYSKGD